MSKPTYKIDELKFKNDSFDEQIRTRTIFESLKEKAIKLEPLCEFEKDFFCQCLSVSRLNDGSLEDFKCCENYKFKIAYLAYFHDLSGFGNYEKVKGHQYYTPNRREIDRDIEYLSSVADEWLNTINIANHKEELLQQISAETREDIKEFSKSKGFLLFRKDKLNYKINFRKTLLQSKFIYCLALKIFEMFDKKEFILTLNGQEIEMNEYSIIHILNRHYAQITKPNSRKSFHNEDFIPQYLNKQLGEIFSLIDSSGLYKDPIHKISFKYKNVNYLIYVQKRFKQVKGNKGNIEYNRLETFYPIIESKENSDLITNFECHKINDDLSIYSKN